MRSIPLAAVLLLTACASLPDVEVCEPDSPFIAPSFARVGNEDFMIASLAYTGCDPYYRFRLCGDGDDWFTEEALFLRIQHDETLFACEDEVLTDELFNLSSIRKRYEKTFDVDAATVSLDFGSLTVDYSFTDELP